MRRKIELIQQIRAMESVPVVRSKFVDLTETGGQGLLAEMSVVEVNKRKRLSQFCINDYWHVVKRTSVFNENSKE